MTSNTEPDSADVDYAVDEDLFVRQDRNEGTSNEEIPACHSCRKKKSKCSRQQPCSQCVKSGVECTYEDKRLKGGIKTGVVERINQRIDALENMFLGQGILLQQFMYSRDGRSQPAAVLERPDGTQQFGNLRSYADTIKQMLSSLGSHDLAVTKERAGEGTAPSKRKADSEPLIPSKRRPLPSGPDEDLCTVHPLPKEIGDTLVAYFKFIHPWVPVLHPATFVRRAREPERSEGVNLILRAILAVAVNYLADVGTEEQSHLRAYASECRHRVMSASMEDNSLEALQALILIAFDALCCGNNGSPWSLVSLITRKVHDLKLNVEDTPTRDDSYAEYFMPSPPTLRPATTWLENEERRRVFWLSFLMDRFASILTCSNPIIISKSIRRRLPCDGCMWESDQAVETSFFNVDDQPQNEANQPEEQNPFPPPNAPKEGPVGIGGLAYTIEATELLSMITKFNQRHSLEWENANELSAWLNKFRNLDSKLLLWELCLTQRWRDVRVVNGYIDPNLTLAHMTHNSAIIMLHRRLAHPPSQSLVWLSRLVSAASGEACVIAAMKIDKISRRYLAISDGIAPHQFAFCLFVAGQVLLAHASYHAVQVPDEVNSIIASLNEVSRRATPDPMDSYDCPETPADKFAKTLVLKRDRDASPDKIRTDQGKSQQFMTFPDFNNTPSTSDIPGVLHNRETSPSSGISPGNHVPFSYGNITGMPQSLITGTLIGTWPLSVTDSGLQTGSDENDLSLGLTGRELGYITDFCRPDPRSKES